MIQARIQKNIGEGGGVKVIQCHTFLTRSFSSLAKCRNHFHFIKTYLIAFLKFGERIELLKPPWCTRLICLKYYSNCIVNCDL